MKPLEMFVYGLCSGLWNVLGEGARAIVRDNGREIYDAFVRDKIDKSSVENALKSFRRAVEELGVCEKIDCSISGDRIEVRVEGCILSNVSDKLAESGVSLRVFCPYAAVIEALLEDIKAGEYFLESLERKPGEATHIVLRRQE